MTDVSGVDNSAGGGNSGTLADAAAGATNDHASAANWRDSLPEDIRGHAALATIADPNALAQQFVDLQGHMGNALRIPGPDAAAEDRQAFHARLLEKVPGLMPTPDPTDADSMNAVYDAMGRPAQVDQYVRPSMDGMPALDESLDKAYTDSAFRNGLTQTQYQNVMSDFLAAQADVAAQQQGAAEGQQAELRQEWGYTYDGNMTAIANTMSKFGFSEGVIEAHTGGGLGKQDTEAFHRMVKALGGEMEMAGQQGGSNTGMTPAEANMQIAEIQRHPDYHNPDITIRQPMIDKVSELMKFALPDAMHGKEAMLDLKRSAG